VSDLRDLYQELILDHTRHPRNFGPLPDANRHADGYNPLCGDRVTVHVRLEGEKLADVHFEGSGCAISTASASLMTESVRGRTKQETEELYERFHALVTGEPGPEPDPAALGKLAVMGGVREFPLRVKCATLVWHALRAALEARDAPVSTE
jgi:nitrogen fixation NifU-like protein